MTREKPRDHMVYLLTLCGCSRSVIQKEPPPNEIKVRYKKKTDLVLPESEAYDSRKFVLHTKVYNEEMDCWQWQFVED